ncbi:MAG: ArnT family glycosyltransferase [Pyrinomonadaceae bacterium]
MADKKTAKSPESTAQASFREFLHTYRRPILIILLLAFGWRLVLVIGFPREAGDEKRYTVPAVNMLAGHGFSSDVAAPILPSEHTVPLYPMFIATVYAVFGQNNSAVRIAQSAIDLLTCLLVAFISFSLAPAKLRIPAAFMGLIIYGFLCWFTVSWTRYILAETLATFLTMLAVTVSVMTLRSERWRWPAVGFICGVALLVRADSALLVAAFGLFLLIQIARLRTSKSVVNLLLFCAAIPLVLAPWTARNYIAFGKFQPLSSPVGKPHGEYVPQGYLLWMRTWLTEANDYHAQDLVFHPGNRDFDPRQLPNDVFDSAAEREEVAQLIARYDQTGDMTPELSEQFRTLANERIRRAPLRFYLWLPLKRVVSMWLTGFTTTNRFHRFARILFVLPILVGGLLGFAIWARNWPLVHLIALIIFTRTALFAFIGAEARYIVEAYPLMIAACGITGAALWRYLNEAREKQWV